MRVGVGFLVELSSALASMAIFQRSDLVLVAFFSHSVARVTASLARDDIQQGEFAWTALAKASFQF